MITVLSIHRAVVVLLSLGSIPSAEAFLQPGTGLDFRPRSSTAALEPRDDFHGRSSSSSRLYVASPRSRRNNKKPIPKEDDKQEEDEGTEVASSAAPRFVPPTPHDENRGSKFRKLKDMIWIRETVEDLTAAEFACSVEAYSPDDTKRRRAVDYDKLLAQLNKRLRDLGCGISDGDDTDMVCELEPGMGMGTTVYNDEERGELFEKIAATRDQLIGVVRGYKLTLEKEEDSLPFKINLPSVPSLQIKKEENVTSSGPKLYVRDDGTLDWDGALQDRAALQMFGTAVWARINGQDPASVDEETADSATGGHHGQDKAVTAKIEDTPQIVEARNILEEMQTELKAMERDHRQLLRSALSEGQAVANVNLASLEPGLRSEIRESADLLDLQRQQVSYKTLVYEMERIYTYLVGEVGNPANKGYVPLQDRLNVAELGLLEAQIESFTREIGAGRPVDADVLAVVGEQVTDLKRRLGIDFYVQGVSFDPEAIKRALADVWMQTKSGLGFYGRGCQLFWNDLIFCGFLLGRAVQGYTLKPREVRNLRRTIKDFFTFIPFIIILLIPISPIGHVLVFGAIQRFFPDFFPSCFTEQRQNLLQLYETAEYSEFKINESVQQKITRLALAAVYFVGKVAKGLVISISGMQFDPLQDELSSSANGSERTNGVDDNSGLNGSAPSEKEKVRVRRK